MTVLPFLPQLVGSLGPAGLGGYSCGSASFLHALWGGCGGVLKKVCTALTRAQPQGQVQRERSHRLPPSQLSQAGQEGVGHSLGELRGGALALAARAQTPEPCWRGGGPGGR